MRESGRRRRAGRAVRLGQGTSRKCRCLFDETSLGIGSGGEVMRISKPTSARLGRAGLALAALISMAAVAAPAAADDWNHRHHRYHDDRGFFSFGFGTPGYYGRRPTTTRPATTMLRRRGTIIRRRPTTRPRPTISRGHPSISSCRSAPAIRPAVARTHASRARAAPQKRKAPAARLRGLDSADPRSANSRP